MHPFGKQLRGNLTNIIYFRHCNHGITSEVGVDDDGLRVGIADDPYTLWTDEMVKFILELRPEIVTFQAVDGTEETHLPVKGNHTCTFRSEVRVIVSSVKQIVYTIFLSDGTKEAAHIVEIVMKIQRTFH